MTQEQVEEILENQRMINQKLDRVLSLYTLEPDDETVNPLLNKKEVAKLLGVCENTIANACTVGEIPHRRIGSKYIFSKKSILLWLHNINTTILDEKMKDFRQYGFYNHQLDRWVRLKIDPKYGAKEEYGIVYDAISEERDPTDLLNADEAVELLQLSISKIRQLTTDFLYYKFPIEKVGHNYQYSKFELKKWMKTRTYKAVKQQFDENVKINQERYAAAEARIEAERQAKEAEKLAKEERRKLRQLKKSEKTNSETSGRCDFLDNRNFKNYGIDPDDCA